MGIFDVCCIMCMMLCFVFKQKTAYEMRISDWSSDVCSSDLHTLATNFDVLRDGQGLADRATFVVDPQGVIQLMEITSEGVGRNAAELLRKLKAAHDRKSVV